MARVQQSLSERVKAKVVREGECLIWKGAMSGNSPVIGKRVSSGKYTNLNIRTVRGIKLFPDTTANTRFTTTCGNPRCIAKEHIILGTAKKQVERRVRRGDTKSNMEANKKLFSLVVHTEATYLSVEINVSYSTILKMLKMNTSMYPYFLMKLEEHCNIEEVRDSDQSDSWIKQKFKLSTFALNFIRTCKDKGYEKAYKRMYARISSGTLEKSDFLKWSEEAKQKRDATSRRYAESKDEAILIDFKKYLGNK